MNGLSHYLLQDGLKNIPKRPVYKLPDIVSPIVPFDVFPHLTRGEALERIICDAAQYAPTRDEKMEQLLAMKNVTFDECRRTFKFLHSDEHGRNMTVLTENAVFDAMGDYVAGTDPFDADYDESELVPDRPFECTDKSWFGRVLSWFKFTKKH